MGLRFVVEEGVADTRDDRPLLVCQRTEHATLRARLFVTEVLGLPLRGDFEGAGQQGLHGGHGDLFHLRESDIEAGPILAPVLSDDDFSPAAGEFLNAAKILGCEFLCGHVASLPAVAEVSDDEIV